MEQTSTLDRGPRVSARERLHRRIPFLVAGGIGISFMVGSVSLGVGSQASPGPGMWPLIVSLVLIGCCLAGLFVATGEDVEKFGTRLIRPLLGLSALSLFVLLFSATGLIITCVVVFVFWFRFLANESWLMSVVLSFAITIGAYLLFIVLLGAVFPPDVVAQLWGGR